MAMRKRLESLDYDMDAWRRFFERRHPRDAAEGFEVLDLDNGAMWDLCRCALPLVLLKDLAVHACMRASSCACLDTSVHGRAVYASLVHARCHPSSDVTQTTAMRMLHAVLLQRVQGRGTGLIAVVGAHRLW